MKKYRYMVAIACVLAGAAGFAGIFAMEQLDSNKKELTKNEQIEQIRQVETTEELGNNQNIAGTDLLAQREDKISKNTEQTEQEKIIPVEDAEIAKNQTNQTQEPKQETAQEPIATNSTENEENPQENVASVETISPEVLHFEAENGIIWPIEGTVLLDYSMDSSIYFPTLQQYQYNPAMVIQGEVNSKVYFVARGKITNIENNEETGCTVTQDLGDGYTAIYGQLKELNFKVGDIVESGQVVGYINEPTKYYAVEGANVYFQLLKDGKPQDPQELLP